MSAVVPVAQSFKARRLNSSSLQEGSSMTDFFLKEINVIPRIRGAKIRVIVKGRAQERVSGKPL
jgi:hypothetical protein